MTTFLNNSTFLNLSSLQIPAAGVAHLPTCSFATLVSSSPQIGAAQFVHRRRASYTEDRRYNRVECCSSAFYAENKLLGLLRVLDLAAVAGLGSLLDVPT